MLLWQQNMHEYDSDYYDVRWDVARRALLYACCVYLALFLMVSIASFTTKGSVEPIIVRAQNAPVLFTGSSQRKTGKGQKHGISKVKQAGAQRPEKTTQKKIIEPGKKKKESKKTEKKIKSPSKAQELKAKEQKLPEKMQTPVRKAIEPKAIAPKKEEKKIEPKKKAPQQVEEKVVKQEEQKQPLQVVLEPKEPAGALASQQPEELLTIVAGVGFDASLDEGGYDAQTKAHMALSRAIARAWKAPQVTIKSPAHIMVELDAGGKPSVIEFEKKSGVVMYDIEARAALMRTDFPQEFWGKKFIIIFGE